MARALACQPELLLLDETAAGLTPTEIMAMIELIRQVRSRGVTIFMIEHVMKAVMSLSDRIYVIHHGEVISGGSPEQVSKDPVVIRAYLGEEYVHP
jgi:branched-chain amino acid transport system ATP-binding protein